MKRIILITLSAAVLIAAGCSTTSGSHSTSIDAEPAIVPQATAKGTVLEGSWHGHETTPGREQGLASLVVTGQSLEFHGPAGDDWLKATFALREDKYPKEWVGTITDCGDTQYIGKKAYAIYNLEKGTLNIAGNAPGDSDVPTTFYDPGARSFVFHHDP